MKKTIYIVCLALAFTSCEDTSNKTDDVTQENKETLNTDAASATENPNTEASAPNWMDKIADVDWIDNTASDHKLIFSKPTSKDGNITGELEEHFPGLVIICRYESNSEGALNIHLLKTIRDGVEELGSKTSSLKLQLIDEDNTLVINSPDGRKVSYKRSQNKNSQKETTTETASNNSTDKLWMDKIAAGDWKNVMNNQIVRFNKPTLQGDIIKGEMELNESGYAQVFRYERVADGTMKCNLIRFKMPGDEAFTEESGSGNGYDVTFKTELNDNGNTLILRHSNGNTYTYKQ